MILMRAVFKWYLINDAIRFVLTFVFPRILSQCKKKKRLADISQKVSTTTNTSTATGTAIGINFSAD